MREAKVLSLAEKLAEIWDGSKDTLTKALTDLNYTITKFTDKNISVVGAGNKKPRRYNVDTLRENVEDIHLEREAKEIKKVVKEVPTLKGIETVRSVSRETKVDKWKNKYKGEIPKAPQQQVREGNGYQPQGHREIPTIPPKLFSAAVVKPEEKPPVPAEEVLIPEVNPAPADTTRKKEWKPKKIDWDKMDKDKPI